MPRKRNILRDTESVLANKIEFRARIQMRLHPIRHLSGVFRDYAHAGIAMPVSTHIHHPSRVQFLY